MTNTDPAVGGAALRAPPAPPAQGAPARRLAITTIVVAEPARRVDDNQQACVPARLVLRHGTVAAAGGACHLEVADSDGQTLLNLGPYDEEAVVAVWRRIGAASGLVLGIIGPDGILHLPFRQLGRLVLGPVQRRRRTHGLGRRRPRFLVRRKSASLPRRPLVYREREMAGGPDRF